MPCIRTWKFDWLLSSSRSKAKLEQQANRFALELCVKLHLEEHETLSAKELKQLYGVPYELSELYL